MDEKELEKVTGGGSELGFLVMLESNCMNCAKNVSGCPYGNIEGRYMAFGDNDRAVCPEREVTR